MSILDRFRRKPNDEALAFSLWNAVKNGPVSQIEEIIEKNPKLLELRGEKGATLLHAAAERQNLSSVACLVDLGADTKTKDELGYEPEQVAYWYGEYRMGAYTDTCLKIVERIKAGPIKKNKNG